MFCGNCGHESTSRYCTSCGHPTQAGATPWRGLPLERRGPRAQDLFAPPPPRSEAPGRAAPSARRVEPPTPRSLADPYHRDDDGPRPAPMTLALVAGLLIGLAGVGGLGVWWWEQRTSAPADPVVAGPGASSPAPRIASIPDPASPTDSTPGATAAPAPGDRPQARLEAWREQGVADLSLDGHWVAQLASKHDGVVDHSQTAADGDHTFGVADIAAEHDALRRRFGSEVVLVTGDDFGQRSRVPARLWITLYDPGTFDSQDDVRAWCRSAFAPLSGSALDNVCVPRRANTPHD